MIACGGYALLSGILTARELDRLGADIREIEQRIRDLQDLIDRDPCPPGNPGRQIERLEAERNEKARVHAQKKAPMIVSTIIEGSVCEAAVSIACSLWFL
jgi:hypothetical protein